MDSGLRWNDKRGVPTYRDAPFLRDRWTGLVAKVVETGQGCGDAVSHCRTELACGIGPGVAAGIDHR